MSKLFKSSREDGAKARNFQTVEERKKFKCIDTNSAGKPAPCCSHACLCNVACRLRGGAAKTHHTSDASPVLCVFIPTWCSNGLPKPLQKLTRRVHPSMAGSVPCSPSLARVLLVAHVKTVVLSAGQPALSMSRYDLPNASPELMLPHLQSQAEHVLQYNC